MESKRNFYNKINLLSLLEASLEELFLMKLRIPESDYFLSFYAGVLIHFLQSEEEQLADLIRTLDSSRLSKEEFAFLSQVSSVRLEILQQSVKAKTLESLIELAEQDLVRSGEILFVLGMAFEENRDHVRMKDFYGKAVPRLAAMGAHKKSVKSLLNSVAAESRIHPRKKLIAEYYFTYRAALKAGAMGVAGTCLLNISREYQLIGALSTALKYCNRSIAISRRDFGSRAYFLSIAHRCHLFHQMGRDEEAELDFGAARVCAIPEVQEALKVITMLRGVKTGSVVSPTIDENRLTPSWRERLSTPIEATDCAEGAQEKLAPMENRLIQFVGAAARTKYEIIEHLYGEKLDLSVTENRLRNLLHRIKRRRPSLIVFEEGRYKIADRVFLDGASEKTLFEVSL